MQVLFWSKIKDIFNDFNKMSKYVLGTFLTDC